MRKFLLLCGLCALVGVVSAADGFQNDVKRPEKALVLQLQRQQWQALSAACATPAFYGSGFAMPLVFDDGSKRDMAIPHDTLALSSFGADATAATAKIATTYWKKAERVYVVDGYEQALWIVATAAFESAPILVNPDKATLTALGTKEAITVGSAKAPIEKVTNLATKEDVWKFHMAALAAKGQKCDYIVMTNPHDTDDKLNANVQWPGLSLAAAPLAAFRQAVVQSGDYTGDRAAFHALGGAIGEAGDKAKFEKAKPSFMKVKADSYAVEKFLADAGSMPKFLGMVGGSIELPYYILDIHTKYKYWDLEIHFVPADIPYGTMRMDSDFTRFVKPDLAVGRIMADNVQDATQQLTKTFFYKEFESGGKYAAFAPKGWEKKAVVMDGHRNNQPDEGGPAASPNEPFYPAREVTDVMSKSRTTEYLVPKDTTKPADKSPTAEKMLADLGAYGNIQFVAHGDPPYMRIETGGHGKEATNFLATGPKIRQLMNFDAPTSMYFIACHCSTCYAPFATNEEYVPTSLVHSGAVAFVAPHTCQSICFWRYAPKGPAATQAILFWENALQKKMPIGMALNDARTRSYEEWKDKQYEKDRGTDTDNGAEPDAPAALLFGDPALNIAG